MLSYTGLVAGPLAFPLLASATIPGGGFLALAGAGALGTLVLVWPRGAR